jgi:hypothetical protein
VLGQPSRSSLDVELKCHDDVLYGRGRRMTSGSGGAVEAWLIFPGTGSGHGRRVDSIPHHRFCLVGGGG